MKRIIKVAGLLLTVAALGVGEAQAQGVAIGARAGTLGLGGEAAIGLGSRLALRGGVGVIPYKPTLTFSDIDFEVDPPSPLMTIGLDLYLTPGLRLMGGVLLGADQIDVAGETEGSVQIGDRTYTDVASLKGSVISKNTTAPFVGIGFGRHIASGLGLTLDLGVASRGESTVSFEATGAATSRPEFQAELEKERAQAEEDINDRSYTKLFPILSLGIRFGL